MGRDVLCNVAPYDVIWCYVVKWHAADGLRAAAKPTGIIGVIGGDVAGHSGQANGGYDSLDRRCNQHRGRAKHGY